MKKLLSILLVLSILTGMLAFAASAEDNELTFTVANDLHYNLEYSQKVVKRNSLNEDFAHIGSAGQMHNESVAIIKAFLEKAGNDESEFILLTGDLVHVGTVEENTAMAALLKEFEATYNKQVYVVVGNHDVFETSIEEFESIYADFGFAQALENDPDSAAYTIDLNDEYRLIAIDSTSPGNSYHGMTAEKIEWIKAQGEKAKADGKKLIAAMHHNLLEHFILGNTLHPGAVVADKDLALADVLAGLDIKYVFTGHSHEHDIAKYTAENSNVIYDVVTSTLNSYPSPYRSVTFGEEVKIETRYIDKIDTSILPAGISENALKLAESDFTEYSRQCVWVGFEILLNNCTTAAGLKTLLKIEDEKLGAVIDKVGNKLNEVLNMPFEKADETEEGKSIEAIVQKYNTTIPDTDYENLIDLATALFQYHVIGDESYPAYSDEVILTTRGVAAALSYALEDVTGGEYAVVMSYLVGLLGVNVPVDFFVYAGDGIKRFEGTEIFVTTALLPAVTEFTTDDAPADNNVTLPGYNQLTEEKTELSFLEKVLCFFENLFYILRTLFALLPY